MVIEDCSCLYIFVAVTFGFWPNLNIDNWINFWQARTADVESRSAMFNRSTICDPLTIGYSSFQFIPPQNSYPTYRQPFDLSHSLTSTYTWLSKIPPQVSPILSSLLSYQSRDTHLYRKPRVGWRGFAQHISSVSPRTSLPSKRSHNWR
jgi:hypothetical protein